MLPPLTLGDSKGSFFSRKRVDGGGESTGSKQKLFKTIRPSPRASIHVPTPRTSRTNGGNDDFAASSPSTRPDLSKISMIPREFFVVETNAVLLPQNYPPNQYKSSLNTQGQWETVVFPALTPHNRQQVSYLRQTLDKMRATMPQFDDKREGVGPETETGAERRRLMIEYSSQETQIYSYCFHELARQIKCICKEQSELLHEIRARYDAAVTRLVDQLKILDQQNNQQQDHVAELGTQLQHALDEKWQLAQRIEELEHQVKSGPPVAAAQEAFRLRKLKFRAKRLGRSEEELDNDLYDEKHGEDSESDIDEEETEWRRQRDVASVCRPSISSKHDSTKELNLAATRVQAAFQKYQARKEQTRVTIRVEKQAAAMDIQRSYRGFRDRQLALHRRAIMRTIMRRREENAAVELMQANVRSYLLNRRRSAKLKLSAMTTLKLPGDSDEVPETAPVPVAVEAPVPATEEVAPAQENNDENVNKGDLQDGKESEGGAKPNPRQALMRLLTTFRELASVISTFHRGEVQSVKSEDTPTAVDSAGSYEDPRMLPPRPLSATPSELFDDEDVELFQQTMQEAQALVGSLHVVLGTVAEEKSESDDGELSSDGSNSDLDSDDAAQLDSLDDLARQAQSDRDEINTEAPLADVDSKSDANAFDDYDDNALNISFGERDAMRLQNYAELHLDDSLWSSATYYPASREDMAEAEALLALALASREQRKRLVSLKQFISDMYDTIVGKLTELPPRRLAEMLASRCHLALSFSEWREQRSQLFSRAVGADQPGEQAAIPALTFSIEQLTREHFRCRLGLPQLVDAAVANLVESVEDFAVIDPDVKRFHEFLSKERSEEELVFCCMCRYLCAHRLTSDERPAGTACSSSHRQPMFHPVTMREIIDVPHVLELAKVLFRVEDERAIVESDAPLTEVENSVYRQYLPTNGYHQFEAIVSSFFVDADSQAAAVSSITEGEDQTLASACRRPDGAPRCASAMLRPTNYNQFHAKQYNAQAARSPVVRHQQPSFPSSTAPRWVYLEEVLALLIKYRGEMNHFHLFSYWVQELFGLAAAASSSTSPDATSSAPATQRPGKWLDDTAFVETLAPLSLGPTERELRNIFHNSLRQRELHAFMPVRVFTSVALLLLRNGLLSVSTYAPMQKTPGGGEARQRSLSIREENEDKEWQALALKWRTQESQFEAAIEAIYHDPSSLVDGRSSDKTRAAHALQLLQLRQELYDLFASRSGRGRDLRRALDIYGILVTERLARVGGDTRLLDAQLGASPSLGALFTTD